MSTPSTGRLFAESRIPKRQFDFRDCGLLSAIDEQILTQAQVDRQVILSADTDFTAMPTLRRLPSPPLLLRSADHLSPDKG